MVKEWRYEGRRMLMEDDGNLRKSLNITEGEFDSQWQQFVEEKYL